MNEDFLEMAQLEIVEWPAKVLETPAAQVVSFDEDLQAFVKNMHETMNSSGGIGLAANQVGVLKRVVVICIPFTASDEEAKREKKWWNDKQFTFVNPVITKVDGQIKWQEGCLSFPDLYDFVDRSAQVWVTAQDEMGKTFEVHADELFAVCLQHEIDHIDGIVFFKRMSRLKAERIKGKMLKRGNLNVEE